MAISRIQNTKAALNSGSVKRAGKKVFRGIKADGKALEQAAKKEAQRHLNNAKKGFQKATDKVDRYIKENPKKAVAYAALIAALAAGTASYAIAKRK